MQLAAPVELLLAAQHMRGQRRPLLCLMKCWAWPRCLPTLTPEACRSTDGRRAPQRGHGYGAGRLELGRIWSGHRKLLPVQLCLGRARAIVLGGRKRQVHGRRPSRVEDGRSLPLHIQLSAFGHRYVAQQSRPQQHGLQALHLVFRGSAVCRLPWEPCHLMRRTVWWGGAHHHRATSATCQSALALLSVPSRAQPGGIGFTTGRVAAPRVEPQRQQPWATLALARGARAMPERWEQCQAAAEPPQAQVPAARFAGAAQAPARLTMRRLVRTSGCGHCQSGAAAATSWPRSHRVVEPLQLRQRWPRRRLSRQRRLSRHLQKRWREARLRQCRHQPHR